MTVYTVPYESPLGVLTLVSDGKNLVAVMPETQQIPKSFSQLPGEGIEVLTAAGKWLDQYFSGQAPDISQLPVKPIGTEFQQTVWRRLLSIPYGQNVTYGQIAEEIAKERGIEKMSAQAVGQAVGANPIIIIIPCHRVLGANRKLTGYSGGLNIKVWLLEHEHIPYK